MKLGTLPSSADESVSSTTESDAPRQAGRGFAYQPALDGVRALAVTVVLLFHHGISWMTGGYLGVSVFFTLSGYLITSILVVEHDRSGSISLSTFYGRRVKRLLPASLLCVALVLAARLNGRFTQVAGLRNDLLGALLQVANWVKLAGGNSYAELLARTTGTRGPLEHYWSLAIEEQFYWIWPLAMLGLTRVFVSSRNRAKAIYLLTAVFACLAPIIASVWGANAAYWATPARVAEILAGASLAIWLHERGSNVISPRWAHVVWPALLVIVWACVRWPSSGGPAYAGWLPMFALASTLLLLGLQVDSPLRRVLCLRPLVWLGTISYGLYIFHWPIFVVVTSSSTGLGSAPLLVLRLGLTLAAATLSSALFEQPIRRWQTPGRTAVRVGAAATGLLVAITLATVPAAASRAGIDGPGQTARDDVALQPVDSLAPLVPVVADTTTTGVAAVATTQPQQATQPSTSVAVVTVPQQTVVPVPSRPVRMLVLGDSTAQAIAEGLTLWAWDHPELGAVTSLAIPGCGFIRSGIIPTDGDLPFKQNCDSVLANSLPTALTTLHPDVAMLMVTMRDIETRIWNPTEGPLDPFDARFTQRLTDDYRLMTQQLLDSGVGAVVWVIPPLPTAQFEGPQRYMRDPLRYAVQHDVIRLVASEHPDSVTVVDLDAWFIANDLTGSKAVRPDGLHASPDSAKEISEALLGPALIQAALS